MLAIARALASPVNALEIGEPSVQSRLAEPLRVQVPINLGSLEADEIEIAALEAFTNKAASALGLAS